MTPSEIYTTIQSSPHGSSGRGISYWSLASMCGRKANLVEKHKELFQQADSSEAAGVGVYYHALMEQHCKLQLQGQTWDQTDEMVADDNWQEAVRLYRGYMQFWGSPLAKWSADCLGTEVMLPGSSKGKAGLLDLFNELELTGRADAIFRIQDVEAVYANTQLLLPGPGIYLMDWKTGSTLQSMDTWRYEHGLQAAAYLLMYNAEHPEEPAQGMIFDKVVRHKTITTKSFSHHLACTRPSDFRMLLSLVERGSRNIKDSNVNAAACFEGYKPCPFYTLGLCERF